MVELSNFLDAMAFRIFSMLDYREGCHRDASYGNEVGRQEGCDKGACRDFSHRSMFFLNRKRKDEKCSFRNDTAREHVYFILMDTL